MVTREDLRKLQAQSLDDKVQRTLGLISEWYAYWDNQCYVSFSGGKDSTVLADIAAKWCAIAGIPLYLVFVDTGLEYPEIKEHVRTFAQYLREEYDIDVQLTVLRPKMTFAEVIAKYGYPMIGKEIAGKIDAKRRGLKWCEKFFDGNYCSRYVVKMEPDRMIRFRYATERETQSKYRCMRRAVERLGLDRIAHKNGHTVEVVS